MPIFRSACIASLARRAYEEPRAMLPKEDRQADATFHRIHHSAANALNQVRSHLAVRPERLGE